MAGVPAPPISVGRGPRPLVCWEYPPKLGGFVPLGSVFRSEPNRRHDCFSETRLRFWQAIVAGMVTWVTPAKRRTQSPLGSCPFFEHEMHNSVRELRRTNQLERQ